MTTRHRDGDRLLHPEVEIYVISRLALVAGVAYFLSDSTAELLNYFLWALGGAVAGRLLFAAYWYLWGWKK